MKIIKSIVPLMLSLTLLSGCQVSRGGVVPASSGVLPTSTPTSEPTSAPTSDPHDKETVSHSHIPAQEKDPFAEQIKLSRLSLGLKIGETYALEIEINPHQAIYPVITFESSDEDVATVDSDGVITANDKGICQITAKWGEVSSRACTVYVGEDIKAPEFNSIQTAILSKHKEAEFPVVDKVKASSNWKNIYSKNGKAMQTSRFTRDTIVSREDAYMYMEDHDTVIKAEDGSESYMNDAWVIYTTDDYDTYLFHIDGETKTYMVADSTSFISEGKSRFDAMCSVLDSLFTSGSSLVTGFLTDIYGEGPGLDALTASQYSDVTFTSRASIGEGSLIHSCEASDKDTAGQTEESDYYIPTGTQYDFHISHDYVVDNYLVKSDSLVQSMAWQMPAINEDGDEVFDEFMNAYYIEYEYETEDVELIYPDRAEYAKVDTIFDL